MTGLHKFSFLVMIVIEDELGDILFDEVAHFNPPMPPSGLWI
jgi:hypothetical protein